MDAKEEASDAVLLAEEPAVQFGDPQGGEHQEAAPQEQPDVLAALLRLAKRQMAADAEEQAVFAVLDRIRAKMARLRHACDSEHQFRLLIQAATGDGQEMFEPHLDDLLEMASRDVLPQPRAARPLAEAALRTGKGVKTSGAHVDRRERRAAARAQAKAARARESDTVP